MSARAQSALIWVFLTIIASFAALLLGWILALALGVQLPLYPTYPPLVVVFAGLKYGFGALRARKNKKSPPSDGKKRK
jgi:small basic protein